MTACNCGSGQWPDGDGFCVRCGGAIIERLAAPRCPTCDGTRSIITNRPTAWWSEGQLFAPCPDCTVKRLRLAEGCACLVDGTGALRRPCEAHLRRMLRAIFPRQAAAL